MRRTKFRLGVFLVKLADVMYRPVSWLTIRGYRLVERYGTDAEIIEFVKPELAKVGLEIVPAPPVVPRVDVKPWGGMFN